MKLELFSLKNFSKVFFPVYLVIGLFIFRDFGVSWDEELNRIGTALPAYNYIFHGDEKTYLESSEKYHGPSFELLLLSAERIAGVTDTRSIYFTRHFLTFFFFWLSSIFLFLLARRIFSRHSSVIFCMLMYVLSPRFFGESFFNSKDLGCLSFFTISLYTLNRFLSHKTLRNGFLHALVTGFMIDIRITGLVMPFVSVLALLYSLFTGGKQKPFPAKMVLVFLFYLIIQVLFIILFWPILWINPWQHVHEAFVQMSHYPWYGSMLFMGQPVTSSQIPWYYLPVWMLISIPDLYLILFFTGVVLLFFRVNSISKRRDSSTVFLFISMFLFFVPVFAVMLLHSVVYDGWRHMYFIYAPFVVVAGYGADFLSGMIRRTALKRVAAGIVALQFMYIVYLLMIDHPHQHVYFNLPARIIFRPVTQNFEADFMGLSYRKGLEEILRMNSDSAVHIRVENDPGIFNLGILPAEQRKRISIHGDLHETDYWLAEFRGRKINPDKVNAGIAGYINNSSGRLLTLYKGLRKETRREVVFHSASDYEDTAAYSNLTSLFSYSGKFSEALSGDNNTSDPVHYKPPGITDEEVLEVQLESMVNPADYNPKAMFVLSITRGDSTIYWDVESIQSGLNAHGKWSAFFWNVTLLPENARDGNVVTAYIWNAGQSPLYVDDFKMTVVKYNVGKPVNYFPE